MALNKEIKEVSELETNLFYDEVCQPENVLDLLKRIMANVDDSLVPPRKHKIKGVIRINEEVGVPIPDFTKKTVPSGDAMYNLVGRPANAERVRLSLNVQIIK
ncbi:UNVERIFIED_CONTAM: hypothetical protein RMT77_016475 [Armadillidium vulgare]